MSTTQTRVCNRALRKLGANKLLLDTATAIDNTGDKNAIILKDLYAETLEIVLEEDFWTFGTKRVVLDYATGVTNEWSKYQLNYIYDLPTDFVRLIGWSDETAIVRREGAYLLSDSAGTISTLQVNEDDVDAWSALSVAYEEGDYVTNDDYVYYCKEDHTSGASTEPGTGASWTDYWTVGQEVLSGVWRFVVSTRLGILYEYLNEDVTTWPPHFFETFSTRLALDACYAITNSRPMVEDLKLEYRDVRASAKAKNAQGQTPQTPKADAWVNAKYRGSELISGARRIYFRS